MFFKLFQSRRYWASRQWSQLWKGLPALICVGAGVAALAAVRRPYHSALATRYEVAANRAHDESNEAAEDLCRRRLLVLQPTDPRTRYEYAAALARQDEHGRATRIMQSLAPSDRSGYAPAHFWLAEQIMNSKTPLSPAEFQQLEQRLELSLVSRDAVSAARLPLVDVAIRSRRWEVAAKYLEELVARRPDLLMTLASVYRQQGNESRSATNSDRAAAYYSGLVRQNLQDDANRLRWAEALVFQRKLREAIEVLQAADSAETDPQYGAAIAQVFLMRMTGAGTAPLLDGLNAPADALLAANRPVSALELASRIELLERALHYAPHHPAVLAAIAQLSTQETPDGEQARSWLKDALARGDAPATVHLILGTAAATKGDLPQATFHLEQAHQRDPKLAVAANNLAYVLARSDPPQPEHALQLVDAALQILPQHPEFRETRGQILLMLGHPKEAILDLERVLKSLPGRSEVHAGLAAAYQSLGDQDLADRHQRMAEELKNKPPPPRPRR